MPRAAQLPRSFTPESRPSGRIEIALPFGSRSKSGPCGLFVKKLKRDSPQTDTWFQVLESAMRSSSGGIRRFSSCGGGGGSPVLRLSRGSSQRFDAIGSRVLTRKARRELSMSASSGDSIAPS